MKNWEKVGHVTVDAGMIHIGDPCYLSKENDNPYSDWSEFVSSFEADQKDQVVTLGAGVAFSGFGGDGRFPVYIRRDESGQVEAAMIKFNGLEPKKKK